ncbi:hypothetical protein [Candidatus Thiodiazotropha sp. CDECU1]|uniref:hypothetical protein n=1 Tax=Candidatus Thiodiazotropha sp. CDECU1 TaxID=3065865 RepID=UPI002931567B|nr:hypothetical protein [Candidatus Thiodiazotropha sp. CDECU1]
MTIIKLAILVLWLIPSASLFAAPWTFEGAIDVSAADTNNHYFHHLDSSGRRNIAVSEQTIAIAWEDDRDGIPRIYLAYKQTNEAGFTHEQRVSGEDEAYEPSLIALSRGRFVIAWEELGQIHARMVSVDGRLSLGPITRIDSAPSAQVNLSVDEDRIVAVWSQRSGRYGRIQVKRLVPGDKGRLKPGNGCAVDSVPPSDEQLYPSAIISDSRIIVTWEDRRPKHTIIMAAVEQRKSACVFSEPIRISEKPEGRNLPYGSGHGVSRVALERYGKRGAFAVWADKRDFRDGYDIWGAHFLPVENRFGSNEKVQDDFGGLAKQRHAAITGDKNGTLVVAWDDEREGGSDVVLSWHEDGEWSEDWIVSVASGEGLQSNPSILLDSQGNLHIAWIDRQSIGGATRLKYAFGRHHKTQ